MKYKLIFLLPFLSLKGLAQSNTVASGNSSSNGTGSITYSIGQIDYINQSNQNGNISQGVQQPFEIFNITGITANEKSKIRIFPNPTSDFIIVESDNDILLYTLTDELGKVLTKSEISHSKKINFKELSAGVYFLTTIDQNNKTTTFKIIKNK